MSPTPKLLVLPEHSEIELQPGKNLFQTLAEAGISLNQACGGRGICGKCKVLLSGRVPPPTSLDEEHLSSAEIAYGMRLACSVVPADGQLVELLTSPPIQGKLEMGGEHFPVRPWPRMKPDQLVLAVDLGTTNIVGHLLNPLTGRLVNSAEVSNGQTVFGADVMTRLTYASEGGVKAAERLKALAFNDLENLCRSLGIRKENVAQVVAVMNSAMETLLLGWDPDCLGRYPCEPEHREPVHEELSHPEALSGAHLSIPPVVGGYVGSDTVAALLFALTAQVEPPFMLMDLGTNAESVLVTDREILACSSAAGPAFEGGSITCGLRACDGAIEGVTFTDGRLVTSVMGGGRAKGITGSGLFMLLGELVRHEAIDRFGMLREGRFSHECVRTGRGGKEVVLALHVTVDEGDIQQFLLAKASARAGLDVLLDSTGLKPIQLSGIFLCGTFAGKLRAEDILSLGLLPAIDPAKIINVGNAAAKGAAMMACSHDAFQQACGLAKHMRHMRLSGNVMFMQTFPEHVGFEELAQTAKAI